MKTRIRTYTQTAAGLALLAALAACGGGSFGSGTTGGSGSVEMGSGSGANFQKGVLALSSSSISAGGSTTITINLVDGSGNLLSTPATITLNSNCISSGQASISSSGGGSSNTVTANSGTAIATYTAKGCKGADTITATTTVNSVTLTATGTVNVASAALGSIQFVSASPSTITLSGMGGAGLQQTSTVIFGVKDSVGGAVSGATVSFSLVSATGGVALSQSSAVSDANGDVQTIVQAGSHSGPVTVQASVVISGKTITTTSSGLAIQSGIPSENHFSLSADVFNPEGLDIDGNQVKLTARLADRFGNPVPDGTTVSFTESNFEFGAGGVVEPSCQTTSGACSVTWSSQDPRPTTISGNQHVGFAYVLAFATGEESFTDNNGDGVFGDFKTCASCTLGPENFSDIPEIYAPSDEWETTTQDTSFKSGYNFYDFNSDGIHNGADGLWEGVNCQETVSGLCGTKKSTGVGSYMCIVMAGSNAEYTNAAVNGTATNFGNGTAASGTNGTVAAPGATTVSVAISDTKLNVLPSQTTIKVDATNLVNGSATLSPSTGSGTYTVGNTSCGDSVLGWPLRFKVTFTVTTPPISGSVDLLVTTPSGATSVITIDL